MRYEYEHSILPYGKASNWDGGELEAGHRISIMVRVSHYRLGVTPLTLCPGRSEEMRTSLWCLVP